MPTTAEMFEQGLDCYRAGNLAQAGNLFEQLIRIDPAHADAHYLLGLVKHQTGQNAAALVLVRQAIVLAPANSHFYLLHGVLLKAAGQFAEAVQSYRHGLKLNPQMVEAWYNLGNVLKDMGNVLEAIDCYRQAARINPRFVDAYSNLGVALRDLGQPAEAEKCYRQALEVNPKHFISHYNLGVSLMDLKRLEEAADSFRQALVGIPNYADAHVNLAIVLKDLGQLDEAVASCQNALRLDANHVNALVTLGITLSEMGRMDESSTCFEQTLRLQPENTSARFCLAMTKLAKGDFLPAWPDYEFRWNLPGAVRYHTDRPLWDGGSLEGKTILLHAEQGFGDTIHFIRYAPLVKQRGGTVVVECQPHLLGLLKRLAGIDKVIPDNVPPPPFDVQAPLMSLPGIFGTTLDTIPCDIPYLRADPKRVEHWREEIQRATEEPAGLRPAARLNVGIAWQGRLTRKGDRFRSLALKHFEPLARVPGVQLLSLQVGPGAKQLATVPFPVHDLGSRFDPNSLEDLAAVLVNLDLVVTIDTAVAHLAGALGVTTWIALHIAPCWRYLLGRSDNPWYPTFRIFRQKSLGNWDELFDNIANELAKVPSK